MKSGLYFRLCFFLSWLASNLLIIHAQELYLYSLPEEKVSNALQTNINWEYPNHPVIQLNGKWQLMTPDFDSTLGVVQVPCVFRNISELFFEKHFTIEHTFSREFRLHLGMLNGEVKIWLNDSLIYTHRRNFFPVTLPVDPPLLKEGDNMVRIAIKSSSYKVGTIPSFFPGAMPHIDNGMISPLFLEIMPPTSIRAVDVEPSYTDSTYGISGQIRLHTSDGKDGVYSLTLRIRDSETIYAQQKIDIPAGKKEIHFPLMGIPLPEKKTGGLYAELRLDSLKTTLDIRRVSLAARKVSIASNKLLINGVPVTLIGMNYVYQTKGGTSLFDEAIVRKDLQTIRDAGFNAIRVIMNPLPERFYQICDEVGVWCFQDLPFIYSGVLKKDANQTLQLWKEYVNYLEEMGKRYSSLIGIGIGYYFDGYSKYQQDLLKNFRKNLQTFSLPFYVSTELPNPEVNQFVDFQIVDLLMRNQLPDELLGLQAQFDTHPFFPAEFSNTLSKGIEPEGEYPVYDFFHKIVTHRVERSVEGHFLINYNDFYEHLPSLQNDVYKNVFITPTGVVTIDRKHRFEPQLLFKNGESLPPSNSNANPEFLTSNPANLYIFIGLLNLFIFLIPFNRFKIFRHNIIYSIRRPHGFFVSLLERIFIPYRQSFFLLMVIAINGALVHGAFVYYYRENPILDYMTSLLFWSPGLKATVVKLVWDQIYFLIADTIFIILIFHFFALGMRVLTSFGMERVRFGQALAATIWAASPFVLLLPLGIVMFSILDNMNSYWIFIALLLYFHVLFYFRWINGARVLMFRLYWRVFVVVTFVLLLIVAGGSYLIQYHLNGWEYLKYVFHLYQRLY